MGDYSDGIERINIELSIRNKLDLLSALHDFMQSNLSLLVDDSGSSDSTLLARKQSLALQLLADLRSWWCLISDNLDASPKVLGQRGLSLDHYENVFRAVQSYDLRISWKRELRNPLADIFAGREYGKILGAL